MNAPLLLIGQVWTAFTAWCARRGLAHLFFHTRYLEREVQFWRDKAADNEREIAAQAARFAQERKALLDRFTLPPEAQDAASKSPANDFADWEYLANELGVNPITRAINREKRSRAVAVPSPAVETERAWQDELTQTELDAIRKQTVDEAFDLDAQDEAAMREQMARLAREAALNKAGAV